RLLERLAAFLFWRVHRRLAALERLDDILRERFDGQIESVVAVRRLTFDRFGGLLDRLAEDYDRFTGRHGDPLIALDALGRDFEVEFTLPRQQVLAGILVDLHANGGVFLRNLLEGFDEFREVVHRLSLDGFRDHRLGDVFDRFERRHLHGRDGRAGDGVVESGDGGDVARRHAVDFLALAAHEDP